MAAVESAPRLRALGHPTRLALNRALQARTTGPALAAELAAAVGIPAGEARRHLQALTAVGLVTRLGSGRAARFATVPTVARELAHSVHAPLVHDDAPGPAGQIGARPRACGCCPGSPSRSVTASR